MKFMVVRNEKGIALVMVLVIALIGLGVVSALLFMLTQGTKSSGAYRFFRTAEEASQGGTEVAVEFIKSSGTPVPGLLNTAVATTASNCLQDKLNIAGGATFPPAAWANCTTAGMDLSFNPWRNADLQFDPPTLPGLPQYTVFVKIIDTVAGNTDQSNIVANGNLGGLGVVTSNSGIISPPHNPYLYRVEVQAQNKNNPLERSRYSGLFVH